MNALHVTLAKLVVMSLVGVPLAALVDPTGTYFYLIGGRSYEQIPVAYAWTVYNFVVLVGLYFTLRLGPAMTAYQAAPVAAANRAQLQTLWLASFSAAALCALVLFIQTGFTHPAASTLGLTQSEIAVRRIETASTINGTVYNLGLHVFMAFALATALFVLRSLWLSILSIALFLALATFSLQKSPMADVLVELTFVYLLLRRGSWGTLAVLSVVGVAAIGGMAYLTGWASTASGFALSTGSRVMWGPFADLPHYFARFANEHIGFMAILPPYVQGAIGTVEPSAARLVMQYSNPEAVRAGFAGVSTTLYLGEAFAVGGIPAVIAAPFIAGAMFTIVIRTFGRLRKDAVTVFVLGYLLDRMTVALFSGFGAFLFSAIHIVFGVVVAFALAWLAMPAARGPRLNPATAS